MMKQGGEKNKTEGSPSARVRGGSALGADLAKAPSTTVPLDSHTPQNRKLLAN